MAEQNNISNNINQAVLGLNTDNISQQIKPGTLTYALNAQLESFDGHMITYQNEQSNVLCSEFKPGFKVIGFHTITEQNRTILFLTNPNTGDSEIGQLNNVITCNVDDPTNLGQTKSSNYVNNGYNSFDPNCDCETKSEEVLSFYEFYKNKVGNKTLKVNNCCEYTTIISGKCLNFNINNPIHKSVHRIVGIEDDSKCGTEIYWADGVNPMRFINLDDLPFEETFLECDRIKTGTIDCDLLEVQPTMDIPCITPLVVTDGGSLVAGSYQFAIQYTNEKGLGYTAFYSVTNGINIFKNVTGLDYNFNTDNSIKINITGLDLRFKYFNLAVIKTINGITEPELVGTYEITKEEIELVYTGNNKTDINLTMNDIFQKFPYYRVAKEVNTSGDLLMWANLQTDKRINYQSVANKIVLNWATYQIPYKSLEGYHNGINSALYRGYMRDEVYAFEIVFLLKNGQQTDGFHIPGRVAEESDLEEISNDDVITATADNCSVDDSTQPRWKVYNTGDSFGYEPEYSAAPDKSCYVGPFESGKFAYWESEKKYPCNPKVWGELADQPIRHHRFPDSLITHIHDSNPNTMNKEFEHKIYPIGIKVDLNNIKRAILDGDIPDTVKDQITGFRIIRSDRVNNKSVIAKGLLYNVGAYVPFSDGAPAVNQEYFYPNYPFNDLGDDPFLTNLSAVTEGGGAGGSSFSRAVVDTLATNVEALGFSFNTLTSLLKQIAAVTYTDTSSAVIIQITNAQKADLENKLFLANLATENLLNRIQIIQDYLDNKSQNDPICMDDMAALTIDPQLFVDFTTAMQNVEDAAAILNFTNIVAYITTNSTTLSSHPQSSNIFDLRTQLREFLKEHTSLQNAGDLVTNSSVTYADAIASLADVSCEGEVSSTSAFSRSRFTFHSPDTHFYQPFLGNILKFETLEGGKSVGNFIQVRDHAGHKLITEKAGKTATGVGFAMGALTMAIPKAHQISAVSVGYTLYYPDIPDAFAIMDRGLFWSQQFKQMIDNLLPYKNYAYQYNAVGYYSNYETIANEGNKQRAVDKAYYLIPGNQAIGDTFTINNWNRESSVYLRTDQNSTPPLLPNDPLIIGSLPEDSSRVDYSENKQIYSDVLSYYGSHKRKVPDQYGDIYTYGVVDTGYCGKISTRVDYTDQNVFIFGGDIFINRFGLKKKLPYFIDNVIGQPNGTDIDYSQLFNIGKVKYWYSTSPGADVGSGFKGLMRTITGQPITSFDDANDKKFYQRGRFYLFSYGISYFFVESEVNVDMRQAGNETDKNFFPNMGTGIPNDWLQEVNVPIVHDNYYIYNKTYSKQNKENFFSHLPITFDPQDKCQDDFTHRVIYSDPNKWRIYKPISFYEFPKNYGKLISIDTIDNTQILVRFENKTYLYNALTTVQTSSGKYAYLGNDDVFKAQPIDFGETDLGYAGSQHHFLLRTEAGHLFIDSKRGAIFLINGSTASNIADAGMQKWFDRNLDFEISKFFPEVNIDNHFNGVGITGVWDSKFSRFIITKLDYKPKEQYRFDITYDPYYGKFYYRNQEILLEDPKYFCNKSWTISYSPLSKSWISFHSYIPNFYMGQNGTFLTGKNSHFSNEKSSVWIHNLAHTSYQTFYGKLEPYVLEYPFTFKLQDELAQSVKDHTTILEYYNENDFYEINDNVYFNKAILYNNQQTSGILNLYPKPKGKLNLYLQYPIYNNNSKDIIYTKSDNMFNYNTFWDVVKNPNNHNPIWVDSCTNKSIDRELNNDVLDYSKRSFQKTKLRAKDLKVRHINDKFDRYKFVSKFVSVESQKSFK